MTRSRIWPSGLAFVFGLSIFLAAREADSAESRQLQESRVIGQIESYCNSSWRNANIPRAEWSDCSQQVFVDLLERISRRRFPIALLNADSPERRALNRSIWRMIKRWVRAVRHVSLSAADWPDPATIQSSLHEPDRIDKVMSIADERLTPRQRRILSWLVDGYSIGEIAGRLGVPVERASDEKYRTIQKIRRYATDS